jgi:hypothetical protein
MKTRDDFAIAAMQAIATGTSYSPERTAELAYSRADAMIAHRDGDTVERAVEWCIANRAIVKFDEWGVSIDHDWITTRGRTLVEVVQKLRAK